MFGKRDLNKAKKLKKILKEDVKKLKDKALLDDKNYTLKRKIIDAEKSIEDMDRIIKKHRGL
jgi:hypothetical protein